MDGQRRKCSAARMWKCHAAQRGTEGESRREVDGGEWHLWGRNRKAEARAHGGQLKHDLRLRPLLRA